MQVDVPASEMSCVNDAWNHGTLEVHQIFHDQVGQRVSEIFVMTGTDEVESVLNTVRERYIDKRRSLTLPMLFLFNLVDAVVGGIHYSAMVAGADGKGVRWFEPARGGVRERNRPMAMRVRQFLAGNAIELTIGVVNQNLGIGEWVNHCPSQADGSEQEGMRCGQTLRQALLRELGSEGFDGAVESAVPMHIDDGAGSTNSSVSHTSTLATATSLYRASPNAYASPGVVARVGKRGV